MCIKSAFKKSTMKDLKKILLLLIINNVCSITSGHVVKTKHGLIKGLKRSLSNDRVMYTYLGIPYAKPPIGKLRFKPPEPISKLKSRLSADVQKPQCIQSRDTLVRTEKIEGSEDCLYLNIYTPAHPSSIKKYPVMVWLHGGGFYEGDNGYELYPPDNFVKKGIVVVSVSYRLGIFGFLSTGDLISPGNYGIKDQILALKWVNENIEVFGGDKNNITIWGESAGGISVSFMLSANQTKGLFQRAIIESGASIMAVAVAVNQPNYAFTTGKYLGIETNDTEILVERLRHVDACVLQAAAYRSSLFESLNDPLVNYPFGPVIEPVHDGAVISKSPYAILKKGEIHNVTILVGFNSNEGDGLPDAITRNVLTASLLAPFTLVPVGLNLTNITVMNEVGSLIKKRYFPGDNTTYTEEHFVKWYGDMHIIRPMIQFGSLLSKFTKVYFYEFNCIGYLGNRMRLSWTGVGHAEELNYLFNRKTQPVILDEKDRHCSKKLVKLWENFAKYGNPTPTNDTLLDGVTWPVTSSPPNMKYLHIDNNLTVRNNPREDDFKFWTELFDKYAIEPLMIY